MYDTSMVIFNSNTAAVIEITIISTTKKLQEIKYFVQIFVYSTIVYFYLFKNFYYWDTTYL